MCQQRVPFIARRILLPPSAVLNPPRRRLDCKNNREKRKPPEPCNESTVWARHLSTNPNRLQEINRDVSCTFGKSPPLLRFLCPGGEMQKTAAATPTWKRGKVQFEKKKRRNKSNPFHAEDKSSGCRIRGRGNFVHRCAFGSVSSSSSSSFGNCNFLPQNASFLRRSLPPRPPARSGKNSSGTVATVIGPQSDPLRPTEEEEGDRDHESIYIPTW